MSQPKIQALEDDAPIARRHRGYAAQRAVPLEGWNALACAQPLRSEIVESTPPGSIAISGATGARES